MAVTRMSINRPLRFPYNSGTAAPEGWVKPRSVSLDGRVIGYSGLLVLAIKVFGAAEVLCNGRVVFLAAVRGV
jgi:hypothetical protein